MWVRDAARTSSRGDARSRPGSLSSFASPIEPLGQHALRVTPQRRTEPVRIPAKAARVDIGGRALAGTTDEPAFKTGADIGSPIGLHVDQ